MGELGISLLPRAGKGLKPKSADLVEETYVNSAMAIT